MLNQTPDLFIEGSTVVDTVTDFFDRFSEPLSVRGHSAFFILRGNDPKAKLPRRLIRGAFTLVFSNRHGDEEELILESAQRSRTKDETVVVTDNPERAIRAGFLEVRTLRCSEFKKLLFNLERKFEDADSDVLDSFGDVDFWSEFFGFSSDMKINLKSREGDTRDIEKGD